jgi:hypothetical protein
VELIMQYMLVIEDTGLRKLESTQHTDEGPETQSGVQSTKRIVASTLVHKLEQLVNPRVEYYTSLRADEVPGFNEVRQTLYLKVTISMLKDEGYKKAARYVR